MAGQVAAGPVNVVDAEPELLPLLKPNHIRQYLKMELQHVGTTCTTD